MLSKLVIYARLLRLSSFFTSAFIPIPSFKLMMYKGNEVTIILCLSVSNTQQIIIQNSGLMFHNETVNFCHLQMLECRFFG